MAFHFSGSNTTANMFNTFTQPGPFPSNVSTYFRNPSKVVKPSSRNSSPRNTGRRRMTTTGHFSSRPRSVVEPQRASMPQMSHYSSTSHRPISWHPNTFEDLSYMQYPPHLDMGDAMTASPYTTTDYNGLVTPMAFPLADEPQIQELITPLEGLSANDPGYNFNYGQDFSMDGWIAPQQMKDQYEVNSFMYPDATYPAWYQGNHYYTPQTAETPITPEYLPMPDFNASVVTDVQDAEPETEELVGMGLYDSPAEVQSSSLLFSGGLGLITKKSLKLEDAFEPAPEDEDDDDDDDDDEGEDDDDISQHDEDAPAEDDDTDYSQTATTIHHSNDPGALLSSIGAPHCVTNNTYGLTVQQW